MKPSLFLEQSQKIILTQSMRQYLQLLTFNVLELEEFLENEIDQNPFLEKISCSKPPYVCEPASHVSRYEYLMTQAKQIFDKKDLKYAENIIGNLDERGFYPYTPRDAQEEKILQIIQTFDPVGIAATNLQHSLLIQLTVKNKNQSLAYHIISRYYQKFLQKKWDFILKHLNCDKKDLLNAIYIEIAELNFAPGKLFDSTPAPMKSCDLIIQKQDKKFKAIVPDPIHFKTTNPYDSYTTKEIVKWVKCNKSPAVWLIKNLHNRKKTLKTIGKTLIKYQKDFFELKKEIYPISIQELAAKCNVHPTTIHRTIWNKYLKCPRGIFPLKVFFKKSVEGTLGEKISSEAILQKMRRMIQTENKFNPLTDQKIVIALQKQGIKIARRTVSKYRNLLKIPTVSYRKKCL